MPLSRVSECRVFADSQDALKAGSKVPGSPALHQTHALGQNSCCGPEQRPMTNTGVSLVKRVMFGAAPPIHCSQITNRPKEARIPDGTMKAIGTTFADRPASNHFPHVRSQRLWGHWAFSWPDTTRFIPLSSMSESTWSSQSCRSILSRLHERQYSRWTSDRYYAAVAEYPLSRLPFDFYCCRLACTTSFSVNAAKATRISSAKFDAICADISSALDSSIRPGSEARMRAWFERSIAALTSLIVRTTVLSTWTDSAVSKRRRSEGRFDQHQRHCR